LSANAWIQLLVFGCKQGVAHYCRFMLKMKRFHLNLILKWYYSFYVESPLL